jgi:hypothetical protein
VIRPRLEINGNHEEYIHLEPRRVFYEGRWLLGFVRRDGTGVDYYEPIDEDKHKLSEALILDLTS